MNYAPIAVVGYGCALPPRSYDPDRYWQAIVAGESGISTPPPGRWGQGDYIHPDRSIPEKSYCALGGFLQDYQLNAGAWAGRLDPARLNRTQQLVADTAAQALGHAGFGPESPELAGIDLFVGNMLADEALADVTIGEAAQVALDRAAGTLDDDSVATVRKQLASDFPAVPEQTVERVLPSGLATAVATAMGLNSRAVVFDGACASGLLVVDAAVRYLATKPSDSSGRNCAGLVLAVGAMANMSITGNVSFAKIGGLSPSGSHPLDEHASGLIPGEGAGALLLCRLDEALRRGLVIHGVIRGSATRTDGKGRAIYAPNTRGQVAAMRAAMDCAGFGPDDIDHVETHATGTPAGDAEEITSIATVFDQRQVDPVSLGSVKALIGHGFPAAGAANLIKVLQSFKHGQFAPVHEISTPHHSLLANRRVLTMHRAGGTWERPMSRPRRALVNAFGFGGINSCVCVEEFDPAYHQAVRVTTSAPMNVQALAIEAIGHAEEEPTRDVLDATSSFDWRSFRIPPVLVPHLDVGQQLALTAAASALAGCTVDPERTGVVMGQPSGLEVGLRRDARIRLPEIVASIRSTPGLDIAHQQAVAEAVANEITGSVGPTIEAALPGYMDNIVAGRLANQFDLRGPNMVLDTGATSFATACDLAARLMADGDCDAVLVGSANAMRGQTHRSVSPTNRAATILVARSIEWAKRHPNQVLGVVAVSDLIEVGSKRLGEVDLASWVARNVANDLAEQPNSPVDVQQLAQTFRDGLGHEVRVYRNVADFELSSHASQPVTATPLAVRFEKPASPSASSSSSPSPTLIRTSGSDLNEVLRNWRNPDKANWDGPIRVAGAFRDSADAERSRRELERVVLERALREA